MNIKTLIKKGEFHPVYCEDYIYHTPINDTIYLGAVMDGCTMGYDSHFASALFGKILRKVVKEITYKEYYKELPNLTNLGLEQLGKIILKTVWIELRDLANKLFLEPLELLTTLVFSLVNTSTNQAWVMVIGDGCIGVDQKIINVDQGNKPDYLAYHLSSSFDNWLKQQKNIYEFSNINHLSISSDGILSFEKLDKSKPPFQQEIASYLLWDNEQFSGVNSLSSKVDHLQETFGLIVTDDIGIVQMLWGE